MGKEDFNLSGTAMQIEKLPANIIWHICVTSEKLPITVLLIYWLSVKFISNGLNKKPSTSEVVTEKRSAKGVFCSVNKLFKALLSAFNYNF